ncbi:hypothetical protein ACFV4N_06525 [Actinosynnema sp. NPDC059797]
MTPTKNPTNADLPTMVHPVVFSHPADESLVAPRQPRGTRGVQLPRFESLPVLAGA